MMKRDETNYSSDLTIQRGLITQDHSSRFIEFDNHHDNHQFIRQWPIIIYRISASFSFGDELHLYSNAWYYHCTISYLIN